jgi:hypothetical protein
MPYPLCISLELSKLNMLHATGLPNQSVGGSNSYTMRSFRP